MDILRVYCLIVMNYRFFKVKIFQEVLILNCIYGFLLLMFQLQFGLGKSLVLVFFDVYVRVDIMFVYVFQVLFVYGFQKLREIIGLKLGKKIIFNFLVVIYLKIFFLYSKKVFIELRIFCVK